MTQPDSSPEARAREGEAPAEPPQSQPRETRLAPSTMHGALSQVPPQPEFPIRKRPVHGVFVPKDAPVLVFLTVCTKKREKWLAQPIVHAALCKVWQQAQAWRVGRYVIMPDHIHLFAAWIDGSIELEDWVQFWKSQFSRTLPEYSGRWQSGHWDTRLRGVRNYESKWEYVRCNPVRHGLVARPEDWPYQGEMYLLDWNE